MPRTEDEPKATSNANTPIQRVRGTSDSLPPEDARLRSLEARLREGFEAFGYEGLSTPVLEPLELFLRKSGDEILARMYAFTHWNRQLCLRPEITASVMRAYVGDLQGRSLPLRVHYSGPTFRYERPSRGRQRQFNQVGVELIGAAGPAADAEVLQLACQGLEDAGISSYRLVVGHLGVVLQMLKQLGMSEHAQGLILDQMEALSQGRVSADEVVARVVELLGGRSNGLDSAHHLDGEDPLAHLSPEQATAVAAEIMRRASFSLEGGARSPQQIMGRLLSKANRPDPTAQVRAAVEFVLELHAAAGPVANLPRIRAIVERHGLSTEPLDELEADLALLSAYQPESSASWEVDLSLARGLRYYTGLVFEIYVDAEGSTFQVAGGGRYDDLIRALGGRESVPACGFSYGLERVDLVRGAGAGPARLPRVLVVGVSDEDQPEAIRLAQELRRAGNAVIEQDVRVRGPKAALRHADRTDVAVVLVLGERERTDGVVALRDMATREERQVPRSEAVSAVGALLA